MNIITIVLTAIALSMDAFAVSVTKGMTLKNLTKGIAIGVGIGIFAGAFLGNIIFTFAAGGVIGMISGLIYSTYKKFKKK